MGAPPTPAGRQSGRRRSEVCATYMYHRSEYLFVGRVCTAHTRSVCRAGASTCTCTCTCHVSCRLRHMCIKEGRSLARTADGAVFAWGQGDDGCLDGCLGHGEDLSDQQCSSSCGPQPL